MRGMGLAGSRRLVDGLQAHETHQPPHPVTARLDPLAPQVPGHLSGAVKWILQEQFVDAPHQPQVLRALTPISTMTGRIIK